MKNNLCLRSDSVSPGERGEVPGPGNGRGPPEKLTGGAGTGHLGGRTERWPGALTRLCSDHRPMSWVATLTGEREELQDFLGAPGRGGRAPPLKGQRQRRGGCKDWR